MLNWRWFLLATFALCFVGFLGTAPLCNAQEPLKSGPQPNDGVGPLHPLFVNGGKYAGTRMELTQILWFVEPRGLPAVVIFARNTNLATIQLIKKLDAQAAESKQFRVAVVFLSDENELPAKLKTMLEKEQIQQALFTVIASEGPKNWRIAKEAEVTVILLRRTVALGNFAFRAGEFGEAATGRIVESVKGLKRE